MTESVRSLAQEVADALAIERECPFPAGLRTSATRWIDGVLAALFPHFAEREIDLATQLSQSQQELAALVESVTSCKKANANLREFWPALPGIAGALLEDAQAIHYGDPASSSVDEVILTYPGFLAIAIYRIAHELNRLGLPLIPRLLTEIAHQRTGIDLHPAATIGRSFFIDHGTGVVVGATSIIGNGVKLYQGVTLGALTVARELANTKRHPTLEDNVVVYANATILGGETVVGHDSVIGGNAWVTKPIPPYSVVGYEADPRPRLDNPRNSKGAALEFNI